MLSSDSSTTEKDDISFVLPPSSSAVQGHYEDEGLHSMSSISYEYHQEQNVKRHPYLSNLSLEYPGNLNASIDNVSAIYNTINYDGELSPWTDYASVDNSENLGIHLSNNIAAPIQYNQVNSNQMQQSEVVDMRGKLPSTHLVTPQTRHARRIYVGGISPNHTDEDSLRNFLNSVICKCLGDDPDSTYILSIYVNQQKCFAFVELNSIELTTACLELDGILYLNSPLKILRANEYKPELLPPPAFPPIKLNLNGLLFGPTSVHSTSVYNSLSQDRGAISPNLQQQTQQQISFQTPIDPQIDSLIKYCSVNTVQRGYIAIVGFPYDDGKKNYGYAMSTSGLSLQQQMGSNTQSKVPRGCAIASRSIRNALRKYHAGSLSNPEYNVDLSNLKVVDVGDIQGNMTLVDAYRSLGDIICEIIQRGAIPLVIGGPSDLCVHLALGVILISSQSIGMINISPTLDTTLVDDSRFYNIGGNNLVSSKLGLGAKVNCDGRYVQFAAQGSCSTIEQAKIINERGGAILWYNKDLSNDSSPTVSPTNASINSITSSGNSNTPDVAKIFHNTLRLISNVNDNNSPANSNNQSQAFNVTRPTCVSFSMNALSAMHFPGQQQCHSVGLSTNNAIDIALAIGKDPNVVAFSINEFNPDFEESRSSRVVIDIMYHFMLGYAMRNPSVTPSPTAKSLLLSKSPQLPVRTGNINVPIRNTLSNSNVKYNPSNNIFNSAQVVYTGNDLNIPPNNYSNYRPSSAGTFLPSKQPQPYDMSNNLESNMNNISITNNSSYNNLTMKSNNIGINNMSRQSFNRPHSATSPAPSNYNDLAATRNTSHSNSFINYPTTTMNMNQSVNPSMHSANSQNPSNPQYYNNNFHN
eukprot:gene19653-25568_t